MLSRVAHTLYWMSRYVERSENVARILDTNLQLLLDYRDLGNERLAAHWVPLLRSMGSEEQFFSLYPAANGANVTEFLTFRPDNPNSAVSCIAQARENARMVRDQIPIELWEELNRIHLFMRSGEAQDLWRSSPAEFFHAVKASSLYVQGLMQAAVCRDEGWNFMRAGKFLERADMTSRILDTRYESLPADPGGRSDESFREMEWVAILRSCSAWDAYRQIYSTVVRPERVVEFLLLSPDFPRSVRFCIEVLDEALRSLSGVARNRFSNPAEQRAGRLLAELEFGAVEEILAAGLHGFVDSLQIRINEIGAGLVESYFHRAFDEGEETFRQQEEQQQQRA
jgi:uncharacterized alpha-E superfamily protein